VESVFRNGILMMRQRFESASVAWKAPQPSSWLGTLLLIAALIAIGYQIDETLPEYQRFLRLQEELEQKQSSETNPPAPKHPRLIPPTAQNEGAERELARTQLQTALKRNPGALLISMEHSLMPRMAWRSMEWNARSDTEASLLTLVLEAKNPEAFGMWRKQSAAVMPLWASLNVVKEHVLPNMMIPGIAPLEAQLSIQLDWTKTEATLATHSKEPSVVNKLSLPIHTRTSIIGNPTLSITPVAPGTGAPAGALIPPLLPLANRTTP
jgi:hypothetical protein